MSQEVIKCLQGGPLPVISAVITPISRVITPATHLFSAIYRFYRVEITPFVTGRVPPCRINWVISPLMFSHDWWMQPPSSNPFTHGH